MWPEPGPEERDAILAALERCLADEDARLKPSEWWRAGLRETLDLDGNEPG